MSSVWSFIAERLDQKHPVALLMVVNSEDSSPGRPGFKMAVDMAGQAGTIGGGAMELRLTKWARQALTTGQKIPAIFRQVHEKDAPGDRSGLICAGEQTVAIYPCQPEDFPHIRRLLSAENTGLLRLTPTGLTVTEAADIPPAPRFLYETETAWSYEEALGPLDTVYLIGSGHVGLALSRQLALLDFRVIVFDERPEVETVALNTFAHQKIITAYATLSEHIPDDPHGYVVITTCAHQTDAMILKIALTKKLRYVGMLGSARKTQAIFDQLRAEGVSEADLATVQAPIGLQIHSRTAAEIAVSIAAQLIRIKNRQVSYLTFANFQVSF